MRLSSRSASLTVMNVLIVLYNLASLLICGKLVRFGLMFECLNADVVHGFGKLVLAQLCAVCVKHISCFTKRLPITALTTVVLQI